MLVDRRVKVKEIVEMVNISDERVWNILHEHLDIKKLSRWVLLFARRCNSEIGQYALHIDAGSTLLSRLRLLRLLSLFKHEKIAGWKKIHIKWKDSQRNRGQLCSLISRTFWKAYKNCQIVRRSVSS